MQKHYKARDKTVRKMSRDGLVEKNLRSGGSVRVSRREKDSLELPERAEDGFGHSDVRSRRKDRKPAGQKRQRAVDLKKPGPGRADGKGDGTVQADGTAVDPRGPEESEKACESTCQEVGSRIVPGHHLSDRPDGPGPFSNDKKRQQPARVEKVHGDSAGNGFQRQEAQPLDSKFKQVRAAQLFDSKLKKAQAAQPLDNGLEQVQALQTFDSGIEQVQAAPFFHDGDEKTQMPDDDSVKDVPGQAADTEGRVLARPSRMENIKRHPSRDSSFVGTVAETGLTRKKRQERSYAQTRKRKPASSKKGRQDGTYSEKGNGRSPAAEWPDEEKQGQNMAAAENKDVGPPGTSHDEKRDNPIREQLYKSQCRKLFYDPIRNHAGGGKTAGTAVEPSGGQAVATSGNTGRKKSRQEEHKDQDKKRSSPSFDDKTKSGSNAAGKAPEMSDHMDKGMQGQKYSRKEQKKQHRLSFDDEGRRMVRGSGMGIAKKAAFSAAYSATEYADGSGQEQEYGAVDGARKAALAGQGVIRYALRPASRRKRETSSRLRSFRVEKCGAYAEKKDAQSGRLQHGAEQGTGKKAESGYSGGTGQAKKDAVKRWQKQKIKRYYQAARRGERTAAATKAAQTFFAKAKYVAAETFRKNKGILGVAAVLILLFAAVSAGMSGCGAMLQGAASSIIGTTYPGADADIYAVESDYAALEDALDSQINSMESTHPGYDEYLYQVDEISHNPYQLISYFSAKYGGFTYGQVADEIGEIFREQYHLYVDETTETVTETKTVRVGESLGPVATSGYCSCPLCCGIWSGGPTASGVYPTAGHTLAVDASDPFVPLGTKVVMNGVEYVVEDTGSFASYGVQFDVYYADHAAAAAHGRQTWEAYLADSSGGREVEVTTSKEARCLKVTLENRGLDAVLRGRMDADEEGRYGLYNLAYGNRDYLFGTDSLPAGGGVDGSFEVPPEALSDAGAARMIQEAEKYLGFPYVWGGSSPDTSFDCSGFVSWVVNHCGNGWNVGRQTAEGLRGCCTYVPPSEAKPGDLIFFQGTYNTPGASHVGIYVGNDTMIHCGNPVQYSNISTQYWQQHFLGFGRMQ